MKILLGLTGSVATTLAPKIYTALTALGQVRIVATNSALPFLRETDILRPTLFQDKDEWQWEHGNHPANYEISDKWQKDDRILHIELRDWADVFVIAPLTANTLAKIANGFCDNLLTSIVRAWDDKNKPLVLAPAMNTVMWRKQITINHIHNLMDADYKVSIVEPITKMLACGDVGPGAMAEIKTIVKAVEKAMTWRFPLGLCGGIPVGKHPGAFGFERHHDNHPPTKHCGVDLYANENSPVFSCERGVVVAIEHFTGAQDNSPWWLDTDCILIEGPTGVICYGEIEVDPSLSVGDTVNEYRYLGGVKRVVKYPPKNPPIGHKLSMLHLELYPDGVRKASNGFDVCGSATGGTLIDPTPYLLKALGAPKPFPEGGKNETCCVHPS